MTLKNIFGGAVRWDRRSLVLRKAPSECCECGDSLDFEKSERCEICEKPICEICFCCGNTAGLCSGCHAIKYGKSNGTTGENNDDGK